MSEEALPPGWSKHWSNTWKKHYWFHAKSGKQSWEPPRAQPESELGESTGAGTKRAPDDAHQSDPKQQKIEVSDKKTLPHSPDKSQAKEQSSNPKKHQANPIEIKNASASDSKSNSKTPSKPASSGLLGSLLGSIGSLESQQQSSHAAELRRRKKEAEELKRSEEKAERENYTLWVQTTLETFMEGEEPYYEFPQAQALNRGIIQEQSEERGLVSLSLGDDKTGERRVFVFRASNAPNELERRFLTLGGGTVPELLLRRAAGDDFSKYNQLFSMDKVKVAHKARGSRGGGGNEDAEDELEARVVTDRSSFNIDRIAALKKDK